MRSTRCPPLGSGRGAISREVRTGVKLRTANNDPIQTDPLLRLCHTDDGGDGVGSECAEPLAATTSMTSSGAVSTSGVAISSIITFSGMEGSSTFSTITVMTRSSSSCGDKVC